MLMKIKIKAKRYIVPAQKKIARCGKIDKKREFGGSLVKFRAVGTEGGADKLTLSQPGAGYAHRISTRPPTPDFQTFQRPCK